MSLLSGGRGGPEDAVAPPGLFVLSRGLGGGAASGSGGGGRARRPDDRGRLRGGEGPGRRDIGAGGRRGALAGQPIDKTENKCIE